MDTLILSEHENAERILREGWNLFQQKGFRGVSIDELCARCELTKPTLYYYFGSKENLYVQVLLRQLQEFHRVIDGSAGQPMEQRLRSLTLSLLSSLTTDLSTLLRDLDHIKDVQAQEQVHAALVSELFRPLAELMAQGVATGELSPADPNFYSWAFLGLASTFTHRGSSIEPDTNLLVRRLLDLFLHGAAKSGTRMDAEVGRDCE